MTQEHENLYTIKEDDFWNYAQKWFAKELEIATDKIDDCLAKVQELKENGDEYPQRALLPICDIIYYNRFNYIGDEDYDYGYYRDDIECAFIKETSLYQKNENYCYEDNGDNYYKTRIICSDQSGDYDDWPSADFIVHDQYNDFVASVVIYAIIAAIAKSDLMSAATISVYTERIEFEYEDYESNGKLYQKAIKIVDNLLEKTQLFSNVNYDNADKKEKNKERINQIFYTILHKIWDEKAKKQEAYELLKSKYPDHPEFAEKFLSCCC